MKIQEVKATVKKITRLLDQIDDEASAIEKDLVLDYLREAYDLILNAETHQVKPSFDHQMLNPIPNQPIPSPLPLEAKPNTEKETIETKVEPIPKKTPANFNSLEQPKRTAVGQENLMKLFSSLTANDLSEKLGAQPIRNLRQAFSINDKLLYINELFEKNSDLFADTLKMVDNYESWEPAKSVLLNLASQFQWDKGEKSEIARQFIKTIQRKFT